MMMRLNSSVTAGPTRQNALVDNTHINDLVDQEPHTDLQKLLSSPWTHACSWNCWRIEACRMDTIPVRKIHGHILL